MIIYQRQHRDLGYDALIFDSLERNRSRCSRIVYFFFPLQRSVFNRLIYNLCPFHFSVIRRVFELYARSNSINHYSADVLRSRCFS